MNKPDFFIEIACISCTVLCLAVISGKFVLTQSHNTDSLTPKCIC